MTLNAKTGVLVDFLAISACETHFKSELCRNRLRSTCTICVLNFQH